MIRNLEWHAANGDVILFSNAPPFLMEKFLPGVPTGAAETVRGIRADGQNTIHVTAEPLTPSVVGSMHAHGRTATEAQRDFDNLRRHLQSALDPKHFGTLIYNNYAGSFRLRCRPIAGAIFDARIGNSCKLDIEWISDSPHWTAKEPKRLHVGVLTRKWLFPWVIKPTVFGTILSRGIVSNPTMIDIFPRIIISATQSDSVTVGNATTGAFTTITQSVGIEQSIEFDMSVPSAYLIGLDGSREDITHWISVDSEFPWAIAPGENEIYSTVDNPALSPVITIEWYMPEGGL